MDSFLIYTVDDDADFNKVLQLSLKPFPFLKVKTHTSKEEFAKSFKEKRPDLCVLDVNIDQEGEGFQLVKGIRNVIGPDLPIIVLSRRSENLDVNFAIKSGANDFIFKPLDDKYFLLKINDYLPESLKIENLKEEFKTIKSEDQEGFVLIDFLLTYIGIDYLIIKSPFFIAKDIHIKLKGDMIFKIFAKNELSFKVIESLQETEEYTVKLVRDLEQDEYYSLRRWLVANGGVLT